MPKITRDHVKTVTGFVVARSVSAVIVTIAHNNATPTNKLQVAELYVGAYVLGSMVAKHARTHIDEKIDEVAATLAEVKANMPQQ